MRVLSLILLIITALHSFAKKGDIEVRSSPYDFGKVYNWNNPPALFEIVNKSDKTLDFLPTFPTQNFQIKLPQKSIAPGASARVEVYYYTKSTGPFSEKVEIFTGNSAEPIVLKIKGEIISMSPSAFTACPTINKDKETVQEFYQEVLVVDGKTRQPLDNAEVKWFYNNRTKYKNTTDKRGKVVEEVVMGQYSLLATRDGYEPNTANGLISRGTGLIVIPLNPIIVPDYGGYEVKKSEKPRKDPAEGGIYYPVSKTKEKEKPVSKSKVEEAKKQPETIVSAQQDDNLRKNNYADSNDEDDSYDDFRSNHSVNVPAVNVKDKEVYNSRADFSDINHSDVNLSHYENEKASGEETATERAYREKIEALRKEDQQKQTGSSWKSPFDEDYIAPEQANTTTAAVTPTNTKSDTAEEIDSPELEFYNRKSPPKEEDAEQAAYQAYLEELRKLETQLKESYEKPEFLNNEVSQTPKENTTASNNRAASEPMEISNSEKAISSEKETGVMDPSIYAANNVLFLLDVSTSMRGEDRIGLLKLAMNNLIEVMRDFDYLTIMTYSSETAVVLDRVKVENKEELKDIINNLELTGWTFGLKGLNNAFEIVNNTYIADGNNQIIISTDGKFNNPTFTEKDLYSLVREEGGNTKLSVIGFGEDQEALKRMKRLARVGEGNFMHITNKREAGDALIEEIKTQSLLE